MYIYLISAGIPSIVIFLLPSISVSEGTKNPILVRLLLLISLLNSVVNRGIDTKMDLPGWGKKSIPNNYLKLQLVTSANELTS